LNSSRLDKKSDINAVLREINIIVDPSASTDLYNNESTIIMNKNGNKEIRVIKKHTFIAFGLIESIIQRLVVQSFDETNKAYVNTSFDGVQQIMNVAIGITLNDLIKEIYKEGNTIFKRPKRLLIHILIKIAEKLLKLQTSCSFIHGDFHSGNIMIQINRSNENNPNVVVELIDFGFSTIEFSKNPRLLISTPEDCNIDRSEVLDISTNPRLKSIDLLHLIMNLDSFQEKKINVSSAETLNVSFAETPKKEVYNIKSQLFEDSPSPVSPDISKRPRNLNNTPINNTPNFISPLYVTEGSPGNIISSNVKKLKFSPDNNNNNKSKLGNTSINQIEETSTDSPKKVILQSEFHELIEQIKKDCIPISNKNIFKERQGKHGKNISLHVYTRSSAFSENDFPLLYPENFITYLESMLQS